MTGISIHMDIHDCYINDNQLDLSHKTVLCQIVVYLPKLVCNNYNKLTLINKHYLFLP